MNLYEHTIITRPDVSPSQIKLLQDKYTNIVEKFEGNIEKIENWGLLNLSYIIKKIKKVIIFILRLRVAARQFQN